MICSKCGNEMAAGDRFCMACGAENTQEQVQQTEQVQPECEQQTEQVQSEFDQQESIPAPKKNKKKLVLCIVSLTLVLAMVLGGVFTAIKAFGSDGPLSDIGEAAKNSLEAGFVFEATVNDGSHKDAYSGAVLYVDLETKEMLEAYITWEDEIYYIDDEVVYMCGGDRWTIQRNNAEEEDEEDADNRITKLMTELLTYDMERLFDDDMDMCELADYINCALGEEILDPRGFEKCMGNILEKLGDEDYLEENFGYEKKSKGGKATISFEFELSDVVELIVDEFKEWKEAFVYEYEYEEFLEEIKEWEDDFDSSDLEISLEFVIKDDYLVSISGEVAENNNGKTHKTGCSIELSDVGNADLDPKVRKAISTAKNKLGDLDQLSWREGDGYYYYDDEFNKVYLD